MLNQAKNRFVMDKFKNNKNTASRIFIAAFDIFLLYGYHATTMQKIADHAKVNKAGIHYYYRSKEKLYRLVVYSIYDSIFDHAANQKIPVKIKWFLFTELYNNYNLFRQTIIALYPDNWKEKLDKVKQWPWM